VDKLQAYRDKRDAARTPEPVPPPDASPPDQALGGTFVIQEHHARRLHWDFRLERDGVLVSWALPKGVPNDPAVNHLAVHTEDHPLDYGSFEGQIPRGEYGAGAVTIWDRGRYETLKWAPSEVKVVLHGQRVTGGYVLFQTKGNQWMIHRERLTLPGTLRPMLAVTGPAPRDQDRWALEMKWDGVRALAYIEKGKVRLMSRTERDITVTYPELARLGSATTHKQLLTDGEIVVFGDDGWPEFEALQPRMHVSAASQAALLAGQTPVTYLIFDLLQLDGRPLMDLEYTERRALLDELALSGPNWQTPPWFPGPDFAAVQAVSKEHGMEGVVAKRLDSRYTPGVRTDNWRKIKNVHTQEAVVAGYKPGQGNRTGQVGSLLIDLRGPRRDRLQRRDPAHAGGQAPPAAPPRLPVRRPGPPRARTPRRLGRSPPGHPGRLRPLDQGRPDARPGLQGSPRRHRPQGRRP
jgi:bifunctional non-homologous end joining protein LigD